MKTLIFLPTYNERENIGRLIDELSTLSFNKEILIVDDNSNDGTLDIINKKQREIKNLTLIRRTGKKGRGLAGITALKYFIQSDNDIFVEMDADFSHQPKYLPEFLKFFPKYDLVIGSRFIKKGEEKNRGLIRSSISLFANILIRLLFRTKIRDCTSGFRAFKKELLNQLDFNNFISINPEIVEELLYGCVLCDSKIKEIPIVFCERLGGKSKLNSKKILNVFIAIIIIRLRGKKILKQS
ncbi:MAG: polyprenol monophosphomannose synthase [Promethearchaeota archaeon]